MNTPIVVSCGIIRKIDKILIAKRKADEKIGPNEWEFPGGKVQFGEEPVTALARKIKSGLNVTIDVDELSTVVSHVYAMGNEKTHVILLAYFADFVDGEIALNDYADAKWVDYEELNNYGFIAADKAIIKELLMEE